MILAAVHGVLGQTVIHVSPYGQDQWSGRLAQSNPEKTGGPVASLARAQALARELKAAGKAPQGIRVVLANGTYRLSQPLVTPLDGGAAGAPVVYQAAQPGRAIISGGLSVSGPTDRTEGRWAAAVPAALDKKLRFEQLCRQARALPPPPGRSRSPTFR